MSETKLPRIDVIIPAYNAHDTLRRTLGSIIAQDIVDDLDVIIVNDCSDKDYSEFVEMFSKFVNIREIKLEKNGGPGVARQKGIEATKNPLITFIDADDSFSGAFALKTLRLQLVSEPHTVACFGNFLEENQENVYIAHPNDTVWMFGKLYVRSYLDKYNIHFNETRANEDNGFNMMVKLCSNEREKIKFIPDIIYYWHMREDSITRKDNCNYSYNDSFVGYTNNMIYSIKHAEKKAPFNGNIMRMKVEVLCNLYEYYIETVARDPRYIEQNFKACAKYYNEVYREIKDKIEDNIFSEYYSSVMRNSFMGNRLHGIIPVMGIKEWLEKLENTSN